MKELEGKKLLVLGGNNMSKEIVRKAQELGVHTTVTDWYDTQRSPVKLMADDYWNISIEDYDKLSESIKDNHIDGVLTGFTDSYLLPYQHLCELNGLPCYGTKEQFEIFTSKNLYKELCRKNGVPTIEEYSIESENIVYPVLVKPVDGSGSRGITICYNRKELEEAVKTAESSSKQKKVIIERYMDGREVTVFWLFVNGEYYLTTIGNRHVKHNQEGNVIPLPVGYTFPSVYLKKYQADVEEKTKQMFRSVGVKDGMMFMQCKVENDTCYVYDIGYRLSGSIEYKILKQVYGVDPLEMLIRFSLTGKMTNETLDDRIIPSKMKPSFNVSCLCAPGTIKDIIGLDDVKSFPEIIDVVRAHYPGQTITDQMKGLLTQITVRVLGTVDNKAQLYSTMKKVQDTIKIISTEDKDLLLPGIEKEDIEGFVL